MRILAAILLLFIAVNHTYCQDSLTTISKKNERVLLIPEGVTIKVKSLAPLSSKTVNEGDVIDFTVYQDLEIDGKIVIKEGALVSAFIESAEKAKGLGKEGSIKIQFNYTKSVDGTKVPLRSTKGTIEGEGKVGGAVALAVVLSPLFLLKKGKEAKIAEGKIMEAYVSRDVKVTILE